MKGKLTATLIIFTILLVSGCKQGDVSTTATTQPGTPTTMATTVTLAATGQSNTVNIEIKDFKFIPDTITVKGGDIVVLSIVSRDQVEHTFTLDAYNRDIRLPAGGQDSIQFFANKAGTFEFYCRHHPSMRGQLIVTQ